MRTFVLAISITLGSMAAASPEIVSYAIVQDDGSLRVRGKTIRLFAVYIPPSGRICNDAIRPVRCAPRAALALDFRIGARFVHCTRAGAKPDGSIEAVCRVDGEDLGAYLISRGLALARPGAPFEYAALERIARARRRGLWGFPADGYD